MKLAGTHYMLLLGLVVMVLAIAGWRFFTSRPDAVSLEQIAEQIELPEPAGEPVDDDLGLFPEDEYADNPAFFDVEQAPVRESSPGAADAPERSFSTEELAHRSEFEAHLAEALAGDNSQAMELSRFINECSAQFGTAETVERSINFANRRFAEGKSLPRRFAGWPAHSLDNIEAFEQFQWQTFRRCESSRDLFGEDFWERLRREADAGNPAARYLYATLQRLPLDGGLQFERWDEALEHNERVYDYTLSNMNDREPLGILAMAQILPSNSRSPYSRFNTAAVLTTAAIKCGLQSSYLDQQLDDWISHFERMQNRYPDALDQLNEASEEVRQMFCKP